MSALDEYGCDFYLGDATQIGRACSAGEWRGLRDGTLAERFVGFPTCVHGLDVLLLSRAIADVLPGPEVPLLEYERSVAGEEGLWGAEVLPQGWVASVARVPPELAPALHARWMAVHDDEYGPDPEWQAPAVLEAVRGLGALCREAVQRSRHLLLVWTI